jgi:hypothetical protein
MFSSGMTTELVRNAHCAHAKRHTDDEHAPAYTERIGDKWRNDVIDLLSVYPNVYADLSCSELPDFKKLRDELMSATHLSRMKHKLLFGTDFDVLGFGGITLEQYLNSYYDAFGDIDSNGGLRRKLEIENPARFFRFQAKK